MTLAQLIYVVRHGETESNVKGVINDKNINTILTNTGKYMAVQTAQLIANKLNINIDDRIWNS